MNYHYPKSKRQWQEKVERKRKIKELLPDDLAKFNDLKESIININYVTNKNGFEQDQILSKKIKGIKFDFLLVDNNDQKEQVPFKFIIEESKLRLQWNHDYENQFYKNEEFIDLVEKYARMYYVIKILDTNMDIIKLQIKQLKPDFHRIECDYRYEFTDDTDSESEQSKTKEE